MPPFSTREILYHSQVDANPVLLGIRTSRVSSDIYDFNCYFDGWDLHGSFAVCS